MIFIGGGALLTQAVSYALKLGVNVDAVCIPISDSSIPILKNLNVFVVETNNPNIELIPILDKFKDGKVFSINNKFILEDSLLSSGPVFFNIHNGLVQRYRGIAEVCIFAAICNGEKKYGVTLHQILPRQKLDSGPVVAQLEFSIENNNDFFSVLRQSLEACQRIFEDNIENIVGNSYESNYVELLHTSYSYKDVAYICTNAEPKNLTQASNFGPYKSFFAKLSELVDSSCLK